MSEHCTIRTCDQPVAWHITIDACDDHEPGVERLLDAGADPTWVVVRPQSYREGVLWGLFGGVVGCLVIVALEVALFGGRL